MIAASLLKPIIAFSIIGGAVLAGSTVAITSNKTAETTTSSTSEKQEVEDVAPAISQKPRYNWAVLHEGNSKNSLTPGKDEQKIKCKLEGDTNKPTDFCAMSKLPLNEAKKWIDLTEYGKIYFDSHIKKDLITKTKNLYKVRVLGNLIDAWEKDQSKNLEIYKGNGEGDGTELIGKVTPKFAIKNTNIFKGKMKYLVGKVSEWTNSVSGKESKKLINSNKWFTCALPADQGKEVYKNCEFLLFDNDDSIDQPKQFSQKTLNLPLTKAPSIKKDFHYLIKFEEEMTLNQGRYPHENNLKIKVFSNSQRSREVTNDIKAINFHHLSPVFLFEDKNNTVDLALVL